MVTHLASLPVQPNIAERRILRSRMTLDGVVILAEVKDLEPNRVTTEVCLALTSGRNRDTNTLLGVLVE